MGDAIGVAFIIGTDQQAIGHITSELTADIATGADTDTLVFSFEIGFILNVTEAQRASIQTVLALVCGAGNHCAIQLGVFADRDIKAARASKNTGLLLHRVIIAVQLVPAHAQVG